MTHDPCRHSCCVPPSSREAVARYERGLRERKRRLLDHIKEAAGWSHPFVVPYQDRDALRELIDEGLVIETVEGPRPHPV